MSELYRSPTGQVETLDRKKCADCVKLVERTSGQEQFPVLRYTCQVSGSKITPDTYACPLYAKVNGWIKLELVSLSPLKEAPPPAP